MVVVLLLEVVESLQCDDDDGRACGWRWLLPLPPLPPLLMMELALSSFFSSLTHSASFAPNATATCVLLLLSAGYLRVDTLANTRRASWRASERTNQAGEVWPAVFYCLDFSIQISALGLCASHSLCVCI